MASRRLLTAFQRQFVQSRTFAADAHAGGHGAGGKTWKLLSFLVAIPGVTLCYVNAHLKEAEHHEHFHRPDFVAYEHLRMRTKGFPWGDGNHSLFHDAKINALPEGYEDEDEE